MAQEAIELDRDPVVRLFRMVQVRLMMADRGITAIQVSRHLEISRERVSQALRDEKKASTSLLDRIDDAVHELSRGTVLVKIPIGLIQAEELMH